MIIKWRVSDTPVGRYCSFERREWPSAFYENGSLCAFITCEDEYVPSKIKNNDHALLILHIAHYGDHTHGAWTMKRLKKQAISLKEAKDMVHLFIMNHPEFHPSDLRKET